MKNKICDGVTAEDNKTGKFGSTEELLSAYNALESEFTKRCQLVKELQARLDALSAQAENDAALRSSAQCGKAEVRINDLETAPENTDGEIPPQGERVENAPPEYGDGQGARIAQAVELIAANAAECAEMLASLQPVMDECIARYKKKLLGLGALGTPQGTAVIVPAKRPRTLSEAKRLADEMLKY